MPRMIVADLFVGRELRLGKVRHRIARLEQRTVTLIVDDGSGDEVTVSRAELQVRICEETATLVDPLEEPDLADSLPPISLALQPSKFKLDWYHRMILLRALLHHARHSPRSAAYKRAYQDAVALLDWVRRESHSSSTKSWSAKTLNDNLRRWRRAGGAIAAILIQAVPARRKPKRSEEYELFREIVRDVSLRHPNVSVTSVHRLARARHQKILAALKVDDVDQGTVQYPLKLERK